MQFQGSSETGDRGDGQWLQPRQRKRAPVRNGVALSKFNSNFPGRRRLASSKDGHWLLFADSNSNGDFLFLFNKPLAFKVNLPSLTHPLERFFKCLIVSCGIDLKVQVCRYKICLLYGVRPCYFWTSNNIHHWQLDFYSNVMERIYLDAVVSESPRQEDNDDIAGRLFGITQHGLLCGPNLQMQLPNNSMLYNRRRLVFSEEGNRLFLVERKPQTSWEVWEIDINRGTWVSANLDGMVILINGYESVMFSTCMLKPGLLEGNCIVFMDTTDCKTLYVHSLADQTCTVFENKPDSGFPVWYPNARKNWMPWWSFVEDDLRETATSQEPDKSTSIEIRPLCSDKSRDLINLYHNLPRELQSHIAESINSAMEYANFRLVCKEWSEIAHPIRWLPDSSPESAQSPWLMLFQEKKPCSIIDPSCNMKYYMSNKELSGCKIHYSKDGWLLVTKGKHKVFFFEPFSNTKISLPDTPEVYFHPDGMSMSSSPTSSDWVIISTATLIDQLFVMYLRSVDEKWSVQRVILNVSFEASGSNPVFHNHKFYYLASNGDMAVFWWELDVFKYHVVVTDNGLSRPLIKCGFTDRGYLVSCEDKYLCLVVCPPSGNGISVFLLEAVKQGLTYDTSRWKKIKSLRNFSYFISHTSSFALPVSKGSQQQNTINFPLFVENHHLSYKVDTREFRYCNSSGDYIVSRTKPYERNESVVGTWLQPKATRGYRVIEHAWEEGYELELRD